ncbi:MAG TPA: element excision factor XisI family protein [Blastocatellia bacterium]|nr:element excision factor XisI family protein [Blastocatellia bacterium]
MDKLIEYPKLLRRILAEYVELCNRRPDREVETFLVVDPERQDYIWMQCSNLSGYTRLHRRSHIEALHASPIAGPFVIESSRGSGGRKVVAPCLMLC